MVLFQFKAGTSDETLADIFSQLAELKTKCEGIEYYAGGPYSSPENFNQGYTHGFLMTFRDAACRDAYLPHPEHEKVKAVVLANIVKAVAFDFEE